MYFSQAFWLGLLHETSPTLDSLNARVEELAKEISQNSPAAMARCKKLIQTVGTMDYNNEETKRFVAGEIARFFFFFFFFLIIYFFFFLGVFFFFLINSVFCNLAVLFFFEVLFLKILFSKSIRVSKQGQEGLSAFFEKRPPRWD
jgi:hypothetical protein